MPRRASACEIIATVSAPGTWKSTDLPITTVHRSDYADELARARAKTGLDEAVVTGTAVVGEHRIMLIVSEFGFLGGSIGVDTAHRITDAVETATRERLPILALPASGGTRMQEGTRAFVQMVRITAALLRHKEAGLPYLVYLRHPTTGGVLASWGSLGHITFAEPEALVGFLGPRVFEAVVGAPLPPTVQTSENMHAHGLIDQVVPLSQLGSEIGAVLDILDASVTPLSSHPRLETPLATSRAAAWDCVQSTRQRHRPGVRDLLADPRLSHRRLSGSGQNAPDDAVIVAFARLDDRPFVLIGQDRAADVPIGAAGFQAARRGMALAAELDLPLVTIIDTAGAELSAHAEESGIAGQIARCLAELLAIPTPTVSVLLGQGTGGGALAFFPADRVIATEHGWLAPLPPEGASAIVHGGTEHAADLADTQEIGSASLRSSGLVDVVVAEHPDAATHPGVFCRDVLDALAAELSALTAPTAAPESRRIRRYELGVGAQLTPV